MAAIFSRNSAASGFIFAIFYFAGCVFRKTDSQLTAAQRFSSPSAIRSNPSIWSGPTHVFGSQQPGSSATRINPAIRSGSTPAFGLQRRGSPLGSRPGSNLNFPSTGSSLQSHGFGNSFDSFRSSERSGSTSAGVTKLKVLSSLMNGLRNSGLEESVLGEIMQRVFRTALKDLLVPYKTDLISSFVN